MRKLALSIVCALVFGAMLQVPSWAVEPQNGPQGLPAAPPTQTVQSAPQAQPQPQSGYVPPAPIRHTWPGGYRVIIHEMLNNLMDHFVGRY
jgi:hypothetical protein